jgi:hypothetical protein
VTNGVVILGAAQMPCGRLGGVLSSLSAPELGGTVIGCKTMSHSAFV